MMHTVGIDLQADFTRLAIREDQQITLVGDGKRTAIPTLVWHEHWGTDAFNVAPTNWLKSDIVTFIKANPKFWNQLIKCLYEYLGQLTPNLSNNYQTVISSIVSDGDAFSALVQKMGLSMAMPQIEIIPPTSALLVRWLSDQRISHAAFGRLAAVVIGDQTTIITLFESATVNANRWKPIRQLQLSDCGTEGLYTGFMNQLQKSLNSFITSDSQLIVRDNIDDFLERLRSEPSNQRLLWQGVFRGSMKRRGSIFSLSRKGLQESQYYETFVRQRILNSLTKLINGPVDAILLGGQGAKWIVDEEPFIKLGAIWRSDHPDADIAIGAACWPIFKQSVEMGDALPISIVSEEDTYKLLRNRFGH